MGQKQTFITGLTDVYPVTTGQPQASAKDSLGTLRFENAAVYKYVQFSGTTAVNAGDVVCYVGSASDPNGVIVDNASTAMAAGVAQAAVPAGAGAQLGWIQIKGFAVVARALAGTPTAGQYLTTSGAAVGAMTLITSVAMEACAIAYDVANRKIQCDFPY